MLVAQILADKGRDVVTTRPDATVAEVAKLLKTSEVQAAYQRAGTDVVATDPAAFGKFLEIENTKWRKVVQDLKLVVK